MNFPKRKQGEFEWSFTNRMRQYNNCCDFDMATRAQFEVRCFGENMAAIARNETINLRNGERVEWLRARKIQGQNDKSEICNFEDYEVRGDCVRALTAPFGEIRKRLLIDFWPVKTIGIISRLSKMGKEEGCRFITNLFLSKERKIIDSKIIDEWED